MILDKEIQIHDVSVVADERHYISCLFSATATSGTTRRFAFPIDYRWISFSFLNAQFPAACADNSGVAFYDQRVQPNRAALELLNRWLAEDPVVENDEEFEQLKHSVNEHRLSERKRF
jgi:hypothetical protein